MRCACQTALDEFLGEKAGNFHDAINTIQVLLPKDFKIEFLNGFISGLAVRKRDVVNQKWSL